HPWCVLGVGGKKRQTAIERTLGARTGANLVDRLALSSLASGGSARRRLARIALLKEGLTHASSASRHWRGSKQLLLCRFDNRGAHQFYAVVIHRHSSVKL